MNSFLKYILSIIFVLFSALFIYAEKIERHAVYHTIQHSKDLHPEAIHYESNAIHQNQRRILVRTIRQSTTLKNRKLFIIVALFFVQLYLVYKKSRPNINLAIISKPQSHYYLYILNRIRI